MPRRRPTYTNEFRQECVNLLLSSGRGVKRMASELGISPNTLRTWRDRAPMADAAAEIRRLQREVDYLRRQREILKNHEHTLRRPAERYALIDAMRDRFVLSELCEAPGVSRSGYHAARRPRTPRRAQANGALLEQMKTIHAHRHTRCYGSPRMTRELLARGHACSKNRAARLMRLHGLRARPRRPFRPRTTTPDHGAHPSPNLLAEAGPAVAPGVQLVSDITYTAISRALYSGLVIRCAIFHSDRGCQYSSAVTRALLQRTGLRQSMSATGYCYDNAFAESAFVSIKAELLVEGAPFATRRAAATAIFDYFECFYNRRRLHSALDYRSPNDFLTHY